MNHRNDSFKVLKIPIVRISNVFEDLNFSNRKITHFEHFSKSYFSIIFEEKNSKIFFTDFRGGFLLFLLEFVAWRGSMRVNRSLTQRAASSFLFLSLHLLSTPITYSKYENWIRDTRFIEITYMKILLGHVTRRSNQKRKKGQNGSLGRIVLMTLTVMSPVSALLPNQIQNSGQYSQEFLAAFEKRLLQVCP